MQKRRVGIIDILGKSDSKKIFSRYSRANNQCIMPQVVALWCEQAGHDVFYACYSGPQLFVGDLPDDLDVIFINAFTQNAQVAYALSSFYRAKGAVTVIGGPHSRSYPDDSARYYDYVVGFTDKDMILDIVRECAPHRPVGQCRSNTHQPSHLPSLRERWKYVTLVLEKAPIMKIVPILGSLGCPYTCSFCSDAFVLYQPLDFDELKDDLRFIYENKLPRSLVVWHDPNFGIRFDDYLSVIEEAVPPGGLSFIAETSLSLLKEENVKRMGRAGFRAILPGIESWYDLGGKSKMRSTKGMDKVRRVAEQAHMITNYIPYMQANLILGLDADEGPEPFELTRHFIDLVPQVYPYFSLLNAYGRGAPANLEYQREGRVLNVPFHFLNTTDAINVRPKNYDWPTLYDHFCDIYAHAFSPKTLTKRFTARIGAKGVHTRLTRFEMFLRGAASEGSRKYDYIRWMRGQIDDPALRRYLDGETTELPDIFVNPVRHDLEHLAEWLPEGALYHDPNAYLKSLDHVPAQTQAQAGMAMA